jgi:hypothetical protein
MVQRALNGIERAGPVEPSRQRKSLRPNRNGGSARLADRSSRFVTSACEISQLKRAGLFSSPRRKGRKGRQERKERKKPRIFLASFAFFASLR